MNQLNTLIIEGNVVRDAETKTLSGDRKLSTFSIAYNRSTRKQDGTWEDSASYFDCEAWGDVAETAEKNALKGTRVRIVGKIAQNTWTDPEGKKCSKVKIVCDHAEYFSKHSAANDSQDVQEVAEETADEEAFTCPF